MIPCLPPHQAPSSEGTVGEVPLPQGSLFRGSCRRSPSTSRLPLQRELSAKPTEGAARSPLPVGVVPPKLLIAHISSQYRCEDQGGAPRPTPAVPLLTQKRNQKTATRSLWSNPFDCRFSWRRSQSGSLRSHRSAYSLLVQRTAPFIRPEKRQGDLTSFATVACGEPLGCASFSLQPEPRVVGAGQQDRSSHPPAKPLGYENHSLPPELRVVGVVRLQKQPYIIGCPTLCASKENDPLP